MRRPTVNQLLDHARESIEPVDAAWLLAHALGQDRGWLYAHGTDAVPLEVAAAYAGLCRRRMDGEPVAYVTGRQGFWNLQLEVSPATLIPRPETELLVELALARLPPGRLLHVADLGTGSGAIALAIARERPCARIVATDASPDALAVARRNADAHALGSVVFREGDWCVPLAGDTFDVIASNPPYIAAGDPHLAQGDLRFEPPAALASGEDGLEAIRTIVAQAPARLVPGGWLLLEHGWEQGAAVRQVLEAAGFTAVETARDLEGRDRVSLGRAG